MPAAAPLPKSTRDPALAFISLKAFGDFTILAASLGRLPAPLRQQCRLVLGRHLSALHDVLLPGCATDWLDLPDVGVPAVFDLKRCGLAAGARSALALHSALARCAPGARLVFDRLHVRERFVCGRRDAIALPQALNIYTAYEALLAQQFPDTPLTPLRRALACGRRIGLFPTSRMVEKNVPAPVVKRLVQQMQARDFEPVVLLLEGDNWDAPPGLPCEQVPRNFKALASAIASVDAVVSADSLPAHLAAHQARPSFVASRVPNTYWLPSAAFVQGHWGLFTAPDQLAATLGRFLDDLETPGR